MAGRKRLLGSPVRRCCSRNSDCQQNLQNRLVTVSATTTVFLVPLVAPVSPEQAVNRTNTLLITYRRLKRGSCRRGNTLYVVLPFDDSR